MRFDSLKKLFWIKFQSQIFLCKFIGNFSNNFSQNDKVFTHFSAKIMTNVANFISNLVITNRAAFWPLNLMSAVPVWFLLSLFPVKEMPTKVFFVNKSLHTQKVCKFSWSTSLYKSHFQLEASQSEKMHHFLQKQKKKKKWSFFW